MAEIDFMNEFKLAINEFKLELLTILQLIAIRNSSDGNNIKSQAIKKVNLILKKAFYTKF